MDKGQLRHANSLQGCQYSGVNATTYVHSGLGSGARNLVIALVFDFNVGVAHGVIRILGNGCGGSGGGGGGGNGFLILFGHLVANRGLFRRTVGSVFFFAAFARQCANTRDFTGIFSTLWRFSGPHAPIMRAFWVFFCGDLASFIRTHKAVCPGVAVRICLFWVFFCRAAARLCQAVSCGTVSEPSNENKFTTTALNLPSLRELDVKTRIRGCLQCEIILNICGTGCDVIELPLEILYRTISCFKRLSVSNVENPHVFLVLDNLHLTTTDQSMFIAFSTSVCTGLDCV